MASRVKTVRRFVGLGLVVIVVYLGWLLSHVRKPPAVVRQDGPGGPLPARATQEIGCADNYVLSWSGRRLEAARACKNPDGSFTLKNVTLHVPRAAGEGEVVVKSRDGVLPEENGSVVVLEGGVHVVTDDGFTLDGEMLQLRKETSRVTTNESVIFSFGDSTGAAGALDHDWEARRTILSKCPVVHLLGKQTGGRQVDVSGDVLVLDKKANQVDVQGSGVIEFGGGRIEGDRLAVQLSGTSDDVESILATGNARTIMTDAAAAGMAGAMGTVDRRVQAVSIAHEFGEGTALRTIEATGGAALTGTPRGPAPGPSDVLTAEGIRLTFAGADPVRLLNLDANGSPAHFVSHDGDALREVTSATIHGDFDDAGDLTRLDADGSADLRDRTSGVDRHVVADHAEMGFRAGEDAGLESLVFTGKPARLADRGASSGVTGEERTAVAEKGDLRVKPDGRLAAGHLDGGVRLERPNSVASAKKAQVEESSGRTVLSGDASVETEGRVAHGDEVFYDPARRTITVRGRQHTIVKDPERAGGVGVLGSGKEPIYISSDQLVVRDADRRAIYTGGRPSLRRGDNELVADEVELDDRNGSLDARGKVESKLRLVEAGSADAPSVPGLFDATRLIDGRSDVFRYRRSRDVMIYEGDVHLSQQESLLTADVVEVHLLPNGGDVDSMTAKGKVLFKSPGRQAEGDVVEYRSSDGRVRVVGGQRPAHARDEAGNAASGAILEMMTGQSGVRVVAPAGSRTRGAAPLQPGSASVVNQPKGQ